MKLYRSTLVIASAALAAGVAAAACSSAAPTPTSAPTATPTATVAPAVVQVQFANHIQAGLPEQDVFVLGSDGSQVARLAGNDAKDATVLAKPVYAAAASVPHDPFQVGANPLGPYAKGSALGFTLQQWLDATGGGTYTVIGQSAEVSFKFQKLVPNGVYTLWCSRLTFPPNVKVVDTPCGVPDGSQNVFKADAQGAAGISLKIVPVPASSKETASVFAIAYHSDGKTYGPNPGAFGLNSHLQLFFLVPPPSGQ